MIFLLELYRLVNWIKIKIGLASAREPYLIGTTGKDMDECWDVLTALGYQWDYFAWEDIGEGISMRKCYRERQVHVRVFVDGEIRVHDEHNYEVQPWMHYQGWSLGETTEQEKQKILEALQ